MPITKDTITTADGTCAITVATPEGTGPWPAVVMYPDAGGPRQTFDDMAARLAGLGYVVLVPDIYYRDAGWAPFDMVIAFSDETERARLFGMMRKVTQDIMAADAGAFFDYLTRRADVQGDKFGTTGYCMVAAPRSSSRASCRIASPRRCRSMAADWSPTPMTARTSTPTGSARSSTWVRPRTTRPSPPSRARSWSGHSTDAGVEHTVEFYPAAHGFAVPDNVGAYDEAAAQRHWDAMERVFGAALK